MNTLTVTRKQTTNIKIKTIDINALEWFDKVNGNSYFAATVCINFGMPTQRNFILPFQYGYGSHYVDMAKKKLREQGYLKEIVTRENGTSTALWSYCDTHKIILLTSKKENCLQRDLKNLS
jgi:hypothetical protein